jgi:hypothetical protein
MALGNYSGVHSDFCVLALDNHIPVVYDSFMTLTELILEALTFEHTYNTPGAAVAMLHESTGRPRPECRRLLVEYQRAATVEQAALEPVLPGAEHVRGLEVALPQFELPEQSFTLTAPEETQPAQTSLF